MLLISSCASVPTEPLASGELRLLSMHVPQRENIKINFPFVVNINFEADGKPEIIRAVCFCSGNGPYFYKVEHVEYGSHANFSVYLSACHTGSQKLECYTDYVRDGKRRRSNSVFSFISGMSR